MGPGARGGWGRCTGSEIEDRFRLETVVIVRRAVFTGLYPPPLLMARRLRFSLVEGVNQNSLGSVVTSEFKLGRILLTGPVFVC